jgi:hypothetical protein
MSRYILKEIETSHHLILIRLYFILTILITEDDHNHIVFDWICKWQNEYSMHYIHKRLIHHLSIGGWFKRMELIEVKRLIWAQKGKLYIIYENVMWILGILRFKSIHLLFYTFIHIIYMYTHYFKIFPLRFTCRFLLRAPALYCSCSATDHLRQLF